MGEDGRQGPKRVIRSYLNDDGDQAFALVLDSATTQRRAVQLIDKEIDIRHVAWRLQCVQ